MSDEQLQPEAGEPTSMFPAPATDTDAEATTVLPEVADIPPAIEPEPAPESEQPEDSGSKKKMVAIVAASVAAVLVLAGGGFGLWRHQQVQALEQSCAGQVATLQSQQAKLDQYVKSDKVQAALKITESQVADKQTLTALQQAVKAAGDKITVPDCTVGFFDFGKSVDVSSDVALRQSAVRKAVDAVNRSVVDKQVADAKTKLQEVITQAQQTFDGSDGKVQDNAVRDQLGQALEQAKQLVADTKVRDVAKLSTEALTNAVNAVNQSMDAKRQADEQAAAAQAGQVATNTGGNRGYTAPRGNGSGYTAPRNTGGYTAPRNTGGYTAPRNTGGYTAPRSTGGNRGYTAPRNTGGGNSAPRGGGSSTQVAPPTQNNNPQTPDWREFPCEGENCNGWYF